MPTLRSLVLKGRVLLQVDDVSSLERVRRLRILRDLIVCDTVM